MVPCSVYLTQNPFDIPFNVTQSWEFNITTGINDLQLDNPVLVKRGNLILVNQITGKIAIDTTSISKYSDLVWSQSNNVWSQLNAINNYRFFFKYSNPFVGYKCNFELTHKYANLGSYNLTISFDTSNQTYQQLITITEGKKFK